MLRMPERAKYWRCASLVGALWHPSFMRAGGAAADARSGARVLPSATAPAPEEAMNLLRFIDSQYIARPGFGGSPTQFASKAPRWWVKTRETRRNYPLSVGISDISVWSLTCTLPPEVPGGLHDGQRNPHDYGQPHQAVIHHPDLPRHGPRHGSAAN